MKTKCISNRIERFEVCIRPRKHEANDRDIYQQIYIYIRCHAFKDVQRLARTEKSSQVTTRDAGERYTIAT